MSHNERRYEERYADPGEPPAINLLPEHREHGRARPVRVHSARSQKAVEKIDAMLEDVFYHEQHEPETPEIRTGRGWVDVRDELMELRKILTEGS